MTYFNDKKQLQKDAEKEIKLKSNTFIETVKAN